MHFQLFNREQIEQRRKDDERRREEKRLATMDRLEEEEKYRSMMQQAKERRAKVRRLFIGIFWFSLNHPSSSSGADKLPPLSRRPDAAGGGQEGAGREGNQGLPGEKVVYQTLYLLQCVELEHF